MKIKKLTAALCAAFALTTLAGCQASFTLSESSSSGVVLYRSVGLVSTLYSFKMPDGPGVIDWSKIGAVTSTEGPGTVILPKTLKAEDLMDGLRKQGELTFITSSIGYAEFGQDVPIGQGATGYMVKKTCDASKHEAEPISPMASVQTLPGNPPQSWVSFDSNFAMRDWQQRMSSCWTVEEARQVESNPYVKHLVVISGGEGIATAWPEIAPSGQPVGNTLTLMVLRPLLME
jgi:hypothetical protein